MKNRITVVDLGGWTHLPCTVFTKGQIRPTENASGFGSGRIFLLVENAAPVSTADLGHAAIIDVGGVSAHMAALILLVPQAAVVATLTFTFLRPSVTATFPAWR